jgi:hypothetical protein
MTQKTALILSVVLTAFLLVVGGGVIAQVSQPESASAAVPTAAPVVTAPSIDVTAQMQELMQQREAQYRQLLDQANRRLTDMNTQLAAAQVAQQAAPARTAVPVAAAPAAQPAAPQIALSSDAARDIAVRAANFATMIRTPELVRFEGKVAYEVGFTRGVVYIDAGNGAVLFNGTQGRGGGQSSAQPSSSGGEHESEHESEHEGEHESEHD